MQESFDIEEDVRNVIYLFLDMRNQLVHGITQTERYNIHDNWGQRELLAFLDLFLTLCDPINDIASSCFETSINLANALFAKDDSEKIPIKSRKDIIGLFSTCFKLKQ